MKNCLCVFLLTWCQISIAQYNQYQIVYKDSLDPNLQYINKSFVLDNIDESNFRDILVLQSLNASSASIGIFKQETLNTFTDLNPLIQIDNEFKVENLIYQDINNDDHSDIVYLSNENTVNTLFGLGNGSYQSSPDTNNISALTNDRIFRINDIGDIDKDGDIDLILTMFKDKMYSPLEDSSELLIGWNDGLGDFDFEYIPNEFSAAYYKVHLGDFDGDEDLDLVTVGFGYSPDFGIEVPWYQLPFFRWYSNDGEGNFSEPVLLELPQRVERLPSVSDIHIADLEGDGDMDVFASFAIRDTCEDQIHAFNCSFIYVYGIWKFDDSENNLVQINEINSWPHNYLIESNFNYYEDFFEPFYADYNQDGNIDILSVNTITESIFWRLGDGDGFFEDVIIVDNDADDLESKRPTLKAADMNSNDNLDIFALINTDTISEMRYYLHESNASDDQDNDGYLLGDDCDDNNPSVGNQISQLFFESEYDVCENESLIFSNLNIIPNAAYKWSGPNNFSSIESEPIIHNVTTDWAGEYQVYTTLNHCISDTQKVNAVVHIIPEISLELINEVLEASFIESGSYNWYLNGIIINDANNHIYTPTTSGFYQAEVIDEFGCSNISDSLQVVVSSSDLNVSKQNILYPNPIKKGERLYIDTRGLNHQLNYISIIDVAGKLKIKAKLESNDSFDLSKVNLEKGIYIIKLETSKKLYVSQLVISN